MTEYKLTGKQATKLPFHQAADMFPLMEGKEFNELVGDIKRRGLRIPITTMDEPIPGADGSISVNNMRTVIIDGRNRYLACLKAGVEPRYDLFEGEDIVSFIISANIHRRHLTPRRRRDLLKAILKLRPHQSNREIARQTKSDDKTVAAVRHEMESTAELPQLEKTIGKDGKERPAKNAKPRKSKTSEPAPLDPVEPDGERAEPASPEPRSVTGAAVEEIKDGGAIRVEPDAPHMHADANEEPFNRACQAWKEMNSEQRLRFGKWIKKWISDYVKG
jgi:hypothetical protein